MIRIIDEGEYTLIETKGQTKILTLNKSRTFAWANAEDIGDILITSHRKHWVDHILALGKFRLYDVKNEKDLIDTQHLELFVGKGAWQGYLLPTGLPDEIKIRSRIIPTREIITRASV